MLYMLKKEKYIYPAYVSKYNLKFEKQIIFLMIPGKKGWDYIAVKETNDVIKRINVTKWQ